MGCWNGTCGISQLAILSGEPCRVVFLRAQNDPDEGRGAGFCHPTDVWTPVSLPILGKYNDYGAVDKYDPESVQVKQFFRWLGSRLMPQEKLDEFRNTAIVPSEITDVEQVQDLIHEQRERVRVTDHHDQHSLRWAEEHKLHIPQVGNCLGYVIIREDVYRGLADTSLKTYRGEFSRQSRLDALNKWLDSQCDSARDLAKLEGDHARLMARMLALTSQLGGHDLWSPNEDGPMQDFAQHLGEQLMAPEADIDALQAEVRAVLGDIADFLMVSGLLHGLRKHWAPQSGAGSQDDGLDQQIALHGIMRTAIENLRKAGSDEHPPEIVAAFWSSYTPPLRVTPPQVTRSPERVKLANVVDARGEPIPGVAGATGDGDGYGTLYVVDPMPDANLGHEHLYFIISESGEVEGFTHDFPVGGMYGDILQPVPQSEWPGNL